MNGFDIEVQKKNREIEDEGVFVHLIGLDDMPMMYEDDDGELQPVGVTVAGDHSNRARAFDKEVRRRKITSKSLTGARLHEDNVERAARCTIDWQGFFSGKQKVEFSLHNVRTVYQEAPWVLEQVTEAMRDSSRFFGTKSSSSQTTSGESDD